MSEEHSTFRTYNELRINDRVRLIPGHCCTTVNLHDYIYTHKNGKVTGKIQVTSRGASK